PPRLGLSHIELAAVRREPDAIRRTYWSDDLSDMGPVGACIVDITSISLPPVPFSRIGEPETTTVIEDQVIRTAQFMTIDRIVQALRPTRPQIPSIDTAASVIT